MQLKQPSFQSFSEPPDIEISVNVADTGESILALEFSSAPKGFPYCRHSPQWMRADLVLRRFHRHL
jgi:hypothetical protein